MTNFIKGNYHLFAMTSVAMWSTGFVFTRLSLAYFSPLSISFLRYFLAVVVLLAVAAAYKIKPPQREDWKWVAAAGLSGFSIYMTLFTIASVSITASTASVVVATGPIFTAVLAWVIYKEKLKPVQCFACGLEFLGILIMALVSARMDANYGVLLMLVATILLAAYNIITRKLVKKYSPIQVTIYSMAVGAFALAIFVPQSVADIQAGVPPIGYFYIFVMGVFSSALAFVSWSLALKSAPKISYATNYMFVTPFLTTLLGFLMANELPGSETILGGALIILGLAIFNFHSAMAQGFKKYVLRER
ncbi:MAG: DMT family transporter [Defluviitaleaceae bacterium]|nr:DMT family transporter [Defluviitaleaceae bacterium]